MTHARRGQPTCTATWPLTGRPCIHQPVGGTQNCPAHHPDGDKRRPPPPDGERCTATNKESGERCRMRHDPGGKVCSHHGGGAKQVREAAKARDSERRARALVETYGLPVQITPEAAILAEVHRTAGHVAWLEQQIRAVAPEDLIWGTTKIKEGGDDRGTTQEAVPHVLLKLYQQERAHLAKVCADAIRCGIEERQVKLAESQGVLVARALRAILDGLNLTAAQKALAVKIVPEQLRAMQAAALTN